MMQVQYSFVIFGALSATLIGAAQIGLEDVIKHRSDNGKAVPCFARKEGAVSMIQGVWVGASLKPVDVKVGYTFPGDGIFCPQCSLVGEGDTAILSGKLLHSGNTTDFKRGSVAAHSGLYCPTARGGCTSVEVGEIATLPGVHVDAAGVETSLEKNSSTPKNGTFCPVCTMVAANSNSPISGLAWDNSQERTLTAGTKVDSETLVCSGSQTTTAAALQLQFTATAVASSSTSTTRLRVPVEPGETAFDCADSYHVVRRSWSKKQKSFCCKHFMKGCKFSCSEGYARWKKGWSTLKKEYCCAKAGKGCEGNESLVVRPARRANAAVVDGDDGDVQAHSHRHQRQEQRHQFDDHPSAAVRGGRRATVHKHGAWHAVVDASGDVSVASEASQVVRRVALTENKLRACPASTCTSALNDDAEIDSALTTFFGDFPAGYQQILNFNTCGSSGCSSSTTSQPISEILAYLKQYAPVGIGPYSAFPSSCQGLPYSSESTADFLYGTLSSSMASMLGLTDFATTSFPMCLVFRECDGDGPGFAFMSAGIPLDVPFVPPNTVIFQSVAYSSAAALQVSPAVPIFLGIDAASLTDCIQGSLMLQGQLQVPMLSSGSSPVQLATVAVNGTLLTFLEVAGISNVEQAAVAIWSLVSGAESLTDVLGGGVYEFTLLANVQAVVTLNFGNIFPSDNFAGANFSFNVDGSYYIKAEYNPSPSAGQSDFLFQYSTNGQITLDLGDLLSILTGGSSISSAFSGDASIGASFAFSASTQSVIFAVKTDLDVSVNCDSGPISDIISGINDIPDGLEDFPVVGTAVTALKDIANICGDNTITFETQLTATSPEFSLEYTVNFTMGDGTSFKFQSSNLEIALCGSNSKSNLMLGSPCSASSQCAGSDDDEAYCSMGVGGLGVDVLSFGIFCVGTCTAGESTIDAVENAITTVASDVGDAISDAATDVSDDVSSAVSTVSSDISSAVSDVSNALSSIF